MGVVYLAEDTTLGRRVAMKFLSSTTKEYRARFLREARAVSALTHPNIATVFDYGETAEGQPYIVMELIKGEPLSDKLRAGSLPLTEAVRIVFQIAEAFDCRGLRFIPGHVLPAKLFRQQIKMKSQFFVDFTLSLPAVQASK